MSASTPDLESLLRQLSDGGELSAEQRTALNDLLRGDVDACERYLNHMAVDAQLARETRPIGQSDLPLATQPGRRSVPRPMRRWIATAATVALGIGLAFLASRQPDDIAVATLIFCEGAQWSGKHPDEGAALAQGRYDLRSGIAVVRGVGGQEIAMSGPARLELQSSGRAKLTQGRVLLRTAEGASGFTVATPDGEIEDLGGEFSVRVPGQGGTKICVLDGAVAARSARLPSSRIETKHAVVMRSGEDSLTESKFESTRFSDLIRQAAPRQQPDLMIAYEGFHYEPGRYEPGEISRGKGWAGPWRLRTEEEQLHNQPDETTDMHIVHGKLNVVWPVEGGRLGMLEMPPGKTYRVRPLRNGIDMAEDSVTYFSLMVHEPDHSDRLPRMRPREGVRLTFRSSSHYDGPRLSFGLSAQLHPQIQTDAGVGILSASPAPSSQTTLWIGKILSRRNGEDEISFRIYGEDDALDYAEPAAWHVQTHGVRLDSRLDLVLLTSEGLSARVIDEFRLGPTWRSVVPIQVLLTSN